jgi:hypothetical protein
VKSGRGKRTEPLSRRGGPRSVPRVTDCRWRQSFLVFNSPPESGAGAALGGGRVRSIRWRPGPRAGPAMTERFGAWSVRSTSRPAGASGGCLQFPGRGSLWVPPRVGVASRALGATLLVFLSQHLSGTCNGYSVRSSMGECCNGEILCERRMARRKVGLLKSRRH